jgi:AraC-like DNA-binding protein
MLSRNRIKNRESTVTLLKTKMRLVLLGACILGLTGWIFSIGQDQDISVDKLLNNLQTEHFSGKPIDLDLDKADIETLLKYLEGSSGLSFKLSPDIDQLSEGKKTYSFKQVPWDQVLFLVLKEFGLEAVLKDGGVYIQSKTDNLKRIIREDQLQSPKSLRIHPLLYVLIFVAAAGGIAGFLLYKRRLTAKKEASKRLVIDPDIAYEVIKKVTYLFDVEKVYRNEDISLQSLSEDLSIPSYQLSWILNERMNITFSVLVNTFRVEEVKKRLASLQDKDKTILNIAFDAGFNTKTSFNRVFKKYTRMTPSQYRERYMPKKAP